MDISDQDVHSLTSDIFTSMVNLEIETAAAVPTIEGRVYTGCVHIQGPWQGSVTLECPVELAAAAAGVMFDVDVSALAPDEIEDAIGELTNMTGGGVKALMPGPASLSLPTVIDGREYTVKIPGSGIVIATPFTCGPWPLVVRVYEREGHAESPVRADEAVSSGV